MLPRVAFIYDSRQRSLPRVVYIYDSRQHSLQRGRFSGGILICGTGVGISLSANKMRGIRCVTCSEPYSARLSRQHNDTNCLAFGARVIGIETA